MAGIVGMAGIEGKVLASAGWTRWSATPASRRSPGWNDLRVEDWEAMIDVNVKGVT